MNCSRARFQTKSPVTALLVFIVSLITCCLYVSGPTNSGGLFNSAEDSTVFITTLLSLLGLLNKFTDGRSRLLVGVFALPLLRLVSGVSVNVSHHGKVDYPSIKDTQATYATSSRLNTTDIGEKAFISSPGSYGIQGRHSSFTGGSSILSQRSSRRSHQSSLINGTASTIKQISAFRFSVSRLPVLYARGSGGGAEEFVNYYHVLSLPEDCSDEDIKAKHEELKESLKSLPSVDRRIKQTIKEAYKVLSNPTSRAMYDQKLKRAASFPSSVDTSDEITDEESDDDADVTLFREPDSDDEVEVSIQEAPNKKRGGLSGFLGNLFGFHRNAGNAEKVDKKNGDLSTTLAVALKDLIFGGTVNVSVDKFVNCRDCNANKQSKNEYLSTCGKCRGRGVISKSQRTPFGYISTSRSCVTCSGRGISRIKDCERCSNTGRVHDTSTIPLDIPAGTKPGSTFKVTSRGHSGGYFARPGNLFVKVVSDHDSREYIEDDHVYTCVDVDYVTAMLGGKMDVETFCGSKQINIPPRTQHGDELTLGKYDGMKHVVKFHIVLPKNPSDEELSLLRKINDLRK